MSKIGVQSQNAEALDYIIAAKFPIWKIIAIDRTTFTRDHLLRYRREVGGLVVLRPYTNEFGPGSSGLSYAGWVNDQYGYIKDLVDAVEILNEPEPTNPDNLRWLNTFTLYADRGLKQKGWKRTVGFNFSVGQPDYPNWRLLSEAAAVVDWIGLHDYDRPDFQDDADLMFRYEAVHVILEQMGIHDKSIFLGEIGIDGAVAGYGHPETGYQRYCSDDAYYARLKTINDRIANQPWAVGATVFGCGMFKPWADGGYDIRDRDVYRNLYKEGGTISLSPSPIPVSAPVQCDPDFTQYAPQTGTWREVAVNLKGVADDALATGREMVKLWGSR